MSPQLIIWISIALAAPSQAGTISGIVRAQPREGAAPEAAGGQYDSRKYKFAERIDYSELRDFVVYIDQPAAGLKPPAQPVQVVTTRKITQKGASFSPHVMPIVVGTTVEWPNYDDIFHNVFSYSEAKQFDLGLYKQPEVKRVMFDKPGRVDAFCSIHTTMSCIILVLENPWFAIADARGAYTITNVPAGTYKLKAWHERLPTQSKEVVVPEKGDVKLDFTMGVINLPKY